MAIATFLDAGVLIAGARGPDVDGERVLAIVEDRERRFVVSPFLYLEVFPKATYHKRHTERVFYERFFREARWVRDFALMDEIARREAEKHGLGAMDALHLAAAHVGGAEELITTEKPSKPIHRSRLARIVYLYG